MEHLKYTPDMARDWKNAIITPEGYLKKRVLDSMNASQLESKLWLVETLIELDIEPKRVALLAGWFAQYIVPLLFDNFRGCEWVENFEIDHDVSPISYKFNKRYKDKNIYKINMRNVMMKPMRMMPNPNLPVKPEDIFDVVINCSCEHMFPMRRFRELNKKLSGNPIYVLQSTNEDKYEDHINCVSGPEELAEQAELTNVVYSGTKVLDNGMNRFMVIGR